MSPLRPDSALRAPSRSRRGASHEGGPGYGGPVAFLARHEWRVLSSSAVTRVVLAVLAAALLAAGLLGAARTLRERETVRAFEQRAARQRVVTSDIRADVAANERGWLALLPPSPLAALAVGQGDVYPNYIKVTARSLDAMVSGDQIEHPQAVASGAFDVAFVILFMYPLLIFAVSFDLTASERDRGTLRMVLSQPVTLRQVVAGKMIVRAVILAVPVVVIPIVVAATASPIDVQFGLRGVAWTVAVLAYGFVWHGLALVVNARGLSAPANALVLAGMWLLLSVVGPSFVNLAIAVRYPMPSRVEAAVEARNATQDATVQGSQQLGQFLQDHPTSANVGRDGMRQFARIQAERDQRVADRLQAVEVSFDAQLRRQQELASWLSLLSPTMVAQGALLDIAGTSTFRFDHFRGAVSVFQRHWRSFFEPKVLDAATLTPAEYAAAPSWRYEPELPVFMINRVRLRVVALGALAALLWWAGFRKYQEYQL